MKQLVLMGAGHAHAQVLLDWARAPVPGVELVVVSPHALAPYSGMVPGWLAGAYRFDEIVINFPALCARAGARWVAAELQSLDAPRRRVRLSTGEELPYDLLSLNVGSTLDEPVCPGATVLPLRPLSALHARYAALLQAWARRTLEPDDPQARQYREQLQRFQCELIAELHNRTDASQRREAATRLQGWARDLRAAGAATATAAGS